MSALLGLINVNFKPKKTEAIFFIPDTVKILYGFKNYVRQKN